jgi:hypothetical protein
MVAPWHPEYARVKFERQAEDFARWLREQRGASYSGWWVLPANAQILKNLEDYARRGARELARQARAVHRFSDVNFMFDTDRAGRPLN